MDEGSQDVDGNAEKMPSKEKDYRYNPPYVWNGGGKARQHVDYHGDSRGSQSQREKSAVAQYVTEVRGDVIQA